MATQTQLAEAQRREQARISAEVTREVLALWLATYEPGNQSAWQGLVAALRYLLGVWRQRSSQSAADYYARARWEAGVRTAVIIPRPAPPVAPELVEATAQITGARAYGRALSSGASEQVARRRAGTLIAGNAARIALDAGRETILATVREDREAIGWARLTDADPCAFCAMLASRGPTYRSRETASFQAHAHCACIATPVWDRREAWLGHSRDLYEQWREVTEGQSGKAAFRAWRRYWEHRNDPPAAG